MKVQDVREIIKVNNFNVKVMARTNGSINATSFDVDDLNALNELLKNHGITFKVFAPGSQFERWSLEAK